MQKIRQPIISVLGHVDHGKTTVLDAIRGSVVAKGEAGGITQHIGASEIPFSNIKKVCGSLLDKIKMEVETPGLLFIDTPGHEAFTTLRKRGGSIADIAILVVDINEGLMPQTKESILYLREFKTPFIIAANKIDRTLGWVPNKGFPFLKTYNEQVPETQQRFEDKFYELVGQLGTEGFNTERYDRVTDFTKQITIVPISGITGEGIPDLLMVIMGLAQKYLKDRIKFMPGKGKGTVLEVKEHKGLGLTLDVILYNGEANRGDNLIIGGKEIVVTKVKGLLKPDPLKEIRVEKKFTGVDYVAAASGIKIIATGIGDVVAGSPLIIVSDPKEVASAKDELKKEIQEVEIHTEKEGAIVKTDTIGSLEAMIKVLKDKGIPIRKAEIGAVSKQDVMEVKNQPDPLIFAFNVNINTEAESMSKDSKVIIISSKIIYKLLEDYDKWVADRKKREEDRILDMVVRPAKMRILPGCVFRQSKPAVFGVEISAGIIKPEFVLSNKGKKIGKINQIQVQGHTVKEAKKGERAAVSMEDVTVGKQVNEGDSLEVFVSQQNISFLEKIRHRLSDDEKQLLDELEGNI